MTNIKNNKAFILLAGILFAGSITADPFIHDHFEKRILSNVHFVSTLLAYTNANSSEIIQVLTDTDNAVVEEIQNMQTGFSKGLEFDYSSSPVTRDILAYEVSRGKHTEKKLWFSGVNVFLKMEAVREAMVPKAYVFPEEMSALADKLSDHGVTIQQLEQNETFEGEKYEVRRLNNETRSYQGHFPATLEGSYLESEITMPLGSWFVDMAQPLAYLIFYLLEPEADDGLVYWNYFDDYLKEKGVSNQRVDFPVFKVFSASSSSDDPELDIVFVRFDADQKNIIVSGIPDNHLQKSVDLISAKGQILTHKNIPQSSNYFQFDCGDLDLGVYLIRVNLGDQTLVRKVFVRHLE